MPKTEMPDITLVSTTESQAELDHATGPNWREHFDPAKAKEEETKAKENSGGSAADDKSDKSGETKTAPASETGKPATSKSEEDEPLPKGVQKRLDRLTARLKETEEKLAAASRRSEPEKAETAKPADQDPEPALKDFKDWNEWNAAHNRWLVRDEQRKLDAKTAEEDAAAAAKETFDAHLGRIEEARVAHEDFEDAIKGMPVFQFSSPAANQAFQMAIVEAENSAELMYHLAKNPQEMAKFATLSPVRVQMLVGQISAKLSPESSASASVARAKPVSRTPAPPTPVRGASSAPTALNDPALVKDTDAWIARRQAQLSSRRH